MEEGIQLQHVCWGRRRYLGASLTSKDKAGQGRVVFTYSVWLTRRLGSPAGRWWQGTVALPERKTWLWGPMAGATRESQTPYYGLHPPSLLVHLWTLVDPVAGGKGKKMSA